ncbi:63 kDa sperm flagellar membrane protein-like [Diadema setosum]|uniref:63 kDa sperm flagellar membrane protein-like n=1 Tax=Diadema setosum TaxID=31175 RepID=UPI003B3BB7B3
MKLFALNILCPSQLSSIFTRRFGNSFFGVSLTRYRLGSLEVDADLQFVNDTLEVVPDLADVMEAFTSSLDNDVVEGFTIDPSRTTVTDVDECIIGTNDCDVNALCSNTMGGFTCTCYEGFDDVSPPEEGAGRSCREIDACISSPCQNGGACSSSRGVHICECPETHDGRNCETARETCSTGLTRCPVRETCNTDTNFCKCIGNRVRNENGICQRSGVLQISIVILLIDGDDSSFFTIITNPTSSTSVDFRRRIIVAVRLSPIVCVGCTAKSVVFSID